jgi:hypothetical protein
VAPYEKSAFAGGRILDMRSCRIEEAAMWDCIQIKLWKVLRIGLDISSQAAELTKVEYAHGYFLEGLHSELLNEARCSDSNQGPFADGD